MLTVNGSDLRIVAYTVAPGRDADGRPCLLAVIGTQDMTGHHGPGVARS